MKRRRFAMVAAAIALLFGSPLGCKKSALGTSNGVPGLSLQDPGPGSVTQTSQSAAETDYAVDFGNVEIGETRVLNLALANTGEVDYHVLTVSGPSDPEVSQTGIVDGTDVQPGGTPITFQLKPFTAGTKTDQIVVTTDSAQVPKLVISLTGVGVELDVTVVPPAVDFGKVVVNSTLARSVVVTNNGALDVSIAPFTVIGNDASLFTILGYDATKTVDLKAGASQTIGVQFAPALPSNSDYTAAFVLQFCDGCANTTVSLRGQGVSSGLQIRPNPLSFGFIPVGSQVTQSITVQNVANQNISINDVFLNDTTGTFGQGSSFPQAPIVLAANQSAVFDITFDPPSSIQYQCDLELVTTDADSNPKIPISGYGGGPQLDCTPPAIDFATVAIGAPVVQQVYCTNVGTDVLDANNDPILAAELQIVPSGLTFALGSSATFTAHLDQPPTGLTAGSTAAIDVIFAPTGAGADQATLNIASNDPTHPSWPVQLSGQAISLPPCAFALDPTSLSFGNVGQGQTGTLAFTIANTGTTECLVAGLDIGPTTSPAFQLKDYPSGLPSQLLSPAGTDAGGDPSSLQVAVAFTPTQPGNFTGSVEFSVSAPSTPSQAVALSGSSAPGCLLIAPSTVDFGVVGYDTGANRWCSTSTRTLTVFNQCNYDIHLTGMTNQDATDFTVTRFPDLTSGPYDVPAESSFTFDVQFTPQSVGLKYGSMQIGTRELAAPYLVDFKGNAQNGSLETDTFVQAQNPQVDILFILDTDDNGTVEQTVAANLPAFLSFAIAQSIDFHIGVTTSDDCAVELGRLDPCPGCAATGSAPLIITTQTEYGGQVDPIGALTNLMTQISNHASAGCNDDVFQPAYLALSQPLVSGYNASSTVGPFLRSGAYLAIIAIDDGDDDSVQSNDFYYNFFESLKGFNSGQFSFNAVDDLTTDPSGGCGQVFYDGPSIRITDMVNRTGGVEVDICTQNWGVALTQLGTIAFGSRRSFALTSTPSSPSAITVETCVNPAVPASCTNWPAIDTANGGLVNWTYDPTTNAVIFDPAVVPLPGQTVVIQYPVECQ